MTNKTKFVIYPDREYTVTLSNGDEVEVSGLDIIQMGESMFITDKLTRKLQELDENGKAWF